MAQQPHTLEFHIRIISQQNITLTQTTLNIVFLMNQISFQKRNYLK